MESLITLKLYQYLRQLKEVNLMTWNSSKYKLRKLKKDLKFMTKEYDKQNSLEYFVVDDFIYKLSQEAIEDIRKNEKKGIAYFKDLQTSTLIEIADL